MFERWPGYKRPSNAGMVDEGSIWQQRVLDPISQQCFKYFCMAIKWYLQYIIKWSSTILTHNNAAFPAWSQKYISDNIGTASLLTRENYTYP